MNSFILVTGGAGYIGAHMVKLLLARDERIVVVDNLSNGHREHVLTPEFVEADIRDRAALRQIFERYPIECVMHFAAFIEVGRSVEAPEEFHDNNVGGTLALLDVMREYGANKLVFSSTAAVYGLQEQQPIPETAALAPNNPYGVTKRDAEALIGERVGELSAMIFRYFNAAGADPEGRIGESHNPETHLIPLALRAAARGDSSLSIFGTDYATADGTCIRDYVHVMDLCEAHYLGLLAMRKSRRSGIYNLGSEQGHSVKKVLDTVRAVTGKPLHARIAGRRPGDSPVLVADSRRARSDLGWRPQFSDLETIVRHAWAWHSRQAT